MFVRALLKIEFGFEVFERATGILKPHGLLFDWFQIALMIISLSSYNMHL
jgi:hypothetical protein